MSYAFLSNKYRFNKEAYAYIYDSKTSSDKITRLKHGQIRNGSTSTILWSSELHSDNAIVTAKLRGREKCMGDLVIAARRIHSVYSQVRALSLRQKLIFCPEMPLLSHPGSHEKLRQGPIFCLDLCPILR